MNRENQALFINRDKPYSDSANIAIELASEERSPKILIEKSPKQFDNLVKDNWGTDKLKASFKVKKRNWASGN